LALSTSFFAGSVFQGVHRVALRVGLFLLLILCPCYSFVTPEVVRPQRPGGVNRRGDLGSWIPDRQCLRRVRFFLNRSAFVPRTWPPCPRPEHLRRWGGSPGEAGGRHFHAYISPV